MDKGVRSPGKPPGNAINTVGAEEGEMDTV